MARIFWDTNLFIYLIEDNGPLADRVEAVWRGMRERGDRLYTSALTLGELLTKPVREGRRDLEQRYTHLFRNTLITVLPFDVGVAPSYARIRTDRSIRPPDAIQLACAASTGADLFITNDDRLSRKLVPEIKFITSLERAPF
ncbi:MAG TPA: PIN domain-containing protein [Candidatus Solibacter sp.]|nr:PIN domain-containing protein [Candidatus Solibacter sp.]